MTKEPIMIDDVDVSGCEFYWLEQDLCNNGNLTSDCQENKDCIYKRYIHKEQECKEWKNKYYSSTTEVKADLIKQLDQLKVENKEYKDIINKLAGKTIAITSGDKPFEFCDHKDLTIKQLKAELKDMTIRKIDYLKESLTYKQALQEIKEIAELKQKQSVFVGETVFEQILQKCEVINE